MKMLWTVGIALAAFAVIVGLVYFSDGGQSDDGYMYALYTDADSNLNVIDVYESHMENGKATALSQRYRTSGAVGGINSQWGYNKDTGKGPFGTFYAAINLVEGHSYDADDAVEKRINSDVGAVAYILDPYDLTRTLAGHSFTPELYNVMLIIPTVYWTSEKVVADETKGNLLKGTEYNVLYISSSSSYTPDGKTTIEGMVPYAHSASTVSGKTDFKTNVYPYLGIGVYESYVTMVGDAVGSGKLVSQSGRIPSSGLNVDEFKDLADALDPVEGEGLQSDYQQWNYYQWTLFRIMGYTIMGSMNAQVMVGAGYTKGNTSPAVTGSTDKVGLVGVADVTRSATGEYSSEAGRTASKLFIENGWGSLNLFVADAYVEGAVSSEQYLYAGNYLGGEYLLKSRNQPPAFQQWADIFVTGEPHRVISGMSAKAATWGTPIAANANASAYSDPNYPGDIVNAVKNGTSSITVGGRWDNIHYAGIQFSCAGYDIALANQFRGARLAYLMSEDAF